MGDILTGIFGGGQQQSQNTTVDPVSRLLNERRLGETNNLFNQANFSHFISGNPEGAYSPTGQAEAFINNSLNMYGQGNGEPDLSNLMSLDDYINFGINQANNYIQQIATPEILSQATLQGLEGGGYVPEAIAKATASIGLPFAQSLPGASATLTQSPEQARLTRAQTGATGAQQASTLFPFVDYPRALREADVNRRQGILTTGFTGIPYTPSTSVQGKTSQQPLFNFFGQG